MRTLRRCLSLADVKFGADLATPARSASTTFWRRRRRANSGASPYRSGPPNSFFRRLHNLTANLTAYRFRKQHDIVLHNRADAMETTNGLLHCLKMSWTLVHKRLKIGPGFYPASVNSAFYFIACRWQTVPERGMVRVTWPTLQFYTPWNIFGMTKATDFKFCARFGHEKY